MCKVIFSHFRQTPMLAWALAAVLLLPIGPMPAEAAGYTSDRDMRQLLLRHFDRWEGAPYKFGGNSRYGVDCSGFVHIAFRDALGVKVPRTTQRLSKSGHRVSSRNLKPGDIIIFRTSRSDLHTGIYIGKNQFIHASKSKGVILSKLSNPYWAGSYEKSVRLL